MQLTVSHFNTMQKNISQYYDITGYASYKHFGNLDIWMKYHDEYVIQF